MDHIAVRDYGCVPGLVEQKIISCGRI